MNDVVFRTRIKFTFITILLSLVFFTAIFVGIIGGLFSAESNNNEDTLENALQRDEFSPFSATPTDNRCIRFDTIGSAIIYRNSQLNDIYETSMAAAIVNEAIETGDGYFRIENYYFRVMSVEDSTYNTVKYAVVERTQTRTLLMSMMWICIVADVGLALVLGLLAFFVSKQAIMPIKEAFDKQRDLTANASHELKTPLTIISTNLDVVKSDEAATVKDNAKWLESIDTQVQRMNGMVCNMLELSKLESTTLPKSLVDLSDVVASQCLTFEAVCFEKGVKLTSAINPDIKIMGERASLERLLLILIDNAVKYSGEKGKVGVSLKADKKHAKLTVLNTGEALSDEDAKHVFDRFYRVDGARTQGKDGRSFGLGLSIAQATVANHGGTISCHGVAGKGTVFEVALPLAKKRDLFEHVTAAAENPCAVIERGTTNTTTHMVNEQPVNDVNDRPNDVANFERTSKSTETSAETPTETSTGTTNSPDQNA